MKIRTGFVSNSSSSSFVLAVKNSVSVDDIIKELKKHTSKIVELFEYADENDYEEVAGFEGATLEQAIDAGIIKIAVQIYSEAKSGLKLEDWNIVGGGASCEEFDLFSNFMYYASDEFDKNILRMGNWE